MAESKVDKALQQLFKRSVVEKPLWENASPASSFPPQEIKLGLSRYDAVDVYTNSSKLTEGSKNISKFRCLIGKKTTLIPQVYYPRTRSVEATAAGVTFGVGQDTNMKTLVTTDENGVAIPVKICGVILSGGGAV